MPRCRDFKLNADQLILQHRAHRLRGAGDQIFNSCCCSRKTTLFILPADLIDQRKLLRGKAGIFGVKKRHADLSTNSQAEPVNKTSKPDRAGSFHTRHHARGMFLSDLISIYQLLNHRFAGNSDTQAVQNNGITLRWDRFEASRCSPANAGGFVRAFSAPCGE